MQMSCRFVCRFGETSWRNCNYRSTSHADDEVAIPRLTDFKTKTRESRGPYVEVVSITCLQKILTQNGITVGILFNS